MSKSLDVSKAIDKAAGAEREVTGRTRGGSGLPPGHLNVTGGSLVGGASPAEGYDITAPNTPDAQKWQGFGTALKPAHEPIVCARKPLIGTVAQNVLTHGTGALNIAGCRIEAADQAVLDAAVARMTGNTVRGELNMAGSSTIQPKSAVGRWPPNVALDESQAAVLDEQSGVLHSQDPATRKGSRADSMAFGERIPGQNYGDKGGASRFMYVAKAPKSERPVVNGVAHPTVKPLTLLRWLVRLVTPPGGTVLDMFAGSGTTIEAAILEGFDVIGIEREADYLPLIQARIDRNTRTVVADADEVQPGLFDADDGEAVG